MPPAKPRVLVLHCYPGGLDASTARWAHGSRIWLSGLALSADDVDATIFDATDALAPLPDASAFDAVIITGSPAGVYERDSLPWIAALEAWLGAALRAPGAAPRVLGGCFGAQIIASSLGGLVEPAGFFRLRTEELEPLPAFATQGFARGVLAQRGGGVHVLAAPDAPSELDGSGYTRARLGRAAAPAGAAEGAAPAGAAAEGAEEAAAPPGGACLRVLESHGDCV
jgi:hypothetical protein